MGNKKTQLYGWREVTLEKVAIINPSESIAKNKIAKKIGMEALLPFTKKIYSYEQERFKGGTKFKNGDTLVARITPSLENGKTAYVDILEKDEIAFGSTEFIIIREKPNITSKSFLYYLCISSEFRSLAIQSMTGTSGRQRVQTDEICNYQFLLPTLPEQKAIAEVLSSLDDKIDLLHRQNKTLENMAQALFRKWFVDEANDDWEEGYLGDLLSVIESGKRPKGGIDQNLKDGFPSIGAESINGIGNFSFNSTKFVTEDFFHSLNKGIVSDFDVLIYKDGAYIGKKTMFGLGFPFERFAINEHVFILRSNERANQFFLYFLLQQDELAMLNANSAQPGLNQQSMKSLNIIIPPKSLIDEFGAISKSFVEKILKNAIQIRTLENLRDTLLPKLMNGSARVKFDKQSS
ncbi:MAG: restriction endonuclease subunit S [Clostridiaceae bacterium]|nr:restriction endonuclease subunit S [Clostridiaceae bacterium]